MYLKRHVIVPLTYFQVLDNVCWQSLTIISSLVRCTSMGPCSWGHSWLGCYSIWGVRSAIVRPVGCWCLSQREAVLCSHSLAGQRMKERFCRSDMGHAKTLRENGSFITLSRRTTDILQREVRMIIWCLGAHKQKSEENVPPASRAMQVRSPHWMEWSGLWRMGCFKHLGGSYQAS